MRTRRSVAVVAEVVFGPLLPTLFLIPFLYAAVLGVGFSIAAALADTSQLVSAKLASVRSQLALVFWVFGAAAGVAALWAAVLRDEEQVDDPRVRLALLAGLGLGEIAALRWLWLMAHQEPAHGVQTWAVWLALLLGPSIIGARHAIALLRQTYVIATRSRPPAA